MIANLQFNLTHLNVQQQIEVYSLFLQYGEREKAEEISNFIKSRISENEFKELYGKYKIVVLTQKIYDELLESEVVLKSEDFYLKLFFRGRVRLIEIIDFIFDLLNKIENFGVFNRDYIEIKFGCSYDKNNGGYWIKDTIIFKENNPFKNSTKVP